MANHLKVAKVLSIHTLHAQGCWQSTRWAMRGQQTGRSSRGVRLRQPTRRDLGCPAPRCAKGMAGKKVRSFGETLGSGNFRAGRD